MNGKKRRERGMSDVNDGCWSFVSHRKHTKKWKSGERGKCREKIVEREKGNVEREKNSGVRERECRERKLDNCSNVKC